MFRERAGVAEIFFIKDPFQRWTFPKGKANPGESLSDAAIRECKEEAGLEGLTLVAPLGRTSFRFRRGVVIQKVVHFFLLKALPTTEAHFVTRENLPPGKEPIFEGKWVSLHDAFAVSSYKNSDKLLARALRLISEQRTGYPPIVIDGTKT